jgi:hypothetical protein
MNMSPLATGLLGVVAVSLSLGAAQLALGSSQGLQVSAGMPAASINRAGKADRVPGVARSDGPTRTISLRLDSLSDMSVLVRVPVAQAARNGAFLPSLMRSGNEKPTVACDPVVSVLTEIAKQLQPGRCIT